VNRDTPSSYPYLPLALGFHCMVLSIDCMGACFAQLPCVTVIACDSDCVRLAKGDCDLV